MYKHKYFKYKNKYLNLKKQLGSSRARYEELYGFEEEEGEYNETDDNKYNDYDENEYNDYDENENNNDDIDEELADLIINKDNLDLTFQNEKGDNIIMYLIKKHINYSLYDYIERDTLIDNLIASNNTDSVILNTRDINNQSIFEITLEDYLEIKNTCKKIEDRKRGVERRQRNDFEYNEYIYYNLLDRQKILLNRLKKIYSKLSYAVQDEMYYQFEDLIKRTNDEELKEIISQEIILK